MNVLAVYNMKGGVGKSTTAVNLAYLSAVSGVRTLLWDLDAQAASSFAFRVHPKIAGFGRRSLEHAGTLNDAIKATDYDNLDLLPADFAYRKLDRFLERLSRPDQRLKELLLELGRGYSHVVLDCPPGLTLLTENVFAAADLVLVPVIPTVLSLRTLVRVIDRLDRHTQGAELKVFLNMVDRRKALHRQISAWAGQHPELFLPAQVPYASAVEQVGVRRMPLSVVAPHDMATTAFESLWREVKARFDLPPAAARSDAVITAIRSLISVLGGEADQGGVRPASSQDWTSSSHNPGAGSGVHQFILAVPGSETLGLLLSESQVAEPARGAHRLAHTFDTKDGDLARDGYSIQLIEESGTFALRVARSKNAVSEETEEESRTVRIDGRWAAEVLSGKLCPINVLKRRIDPPLPAIVRTVASAAGGQPLKRVSWSQRFRRSAGPIVLPSEEGAVTVAFAFDELSGPEREVTYELEVTATGAGEGASEQAIRSLCDRSGIAWQPRNESRYRDPRSAECGGISANEP